jgi:outer membrane protein
MKPIIFPFVFFSVLSLFAQKKWTLQECLQYAEQNNLSLKQAALDADASAIDYKNAKEKMLPGFTFGSSATWNYGLTQNLTTGILENQTVFGNTVRAGADLPVFQGFALQYGKQSAYLNMLLSAYNLENKRKEIEINIVNAYLQILMNNETLKATESQWQSTLTQVKKMKELVEAGVRPESDLKDLEAQAANDYFNYIRTENILKLSLMNLAQLLELDDLKDFDIDTDLDKFPLNEALLLKNPDELYRTSLETLPEYKIVKTREKLARKQWQSARSAYYPGISFFASWNSRYMNREKIAGYELNTDNPFRVIGITENTHENVIAPNFRPVLGPPDPYFTQLENNSGTAFGFSINIPVFNRFQIRRRVQKAAIEMEKAALVTDQQKKQLRNKIFKLHADVINAREKERAAFKNKQAADTAYRYAEEKLKAGLISPYDLENIKSRKIQAETNYISAKYEYYLKLKLLELSVKSYE